MAGFAEGDIAEEIRAANSAKHAFEIAAAPASISASASSGAAWRTAAKVLRDGPSELEVVVFDRDGGLLARTGFRKLAPDLPA